MATNARRATHGDVTVAAPWLSELQGNVFLRASFAYGGELRLHFGSPTGYVNAKLSKRSRGEWVLGLRSSPWVLSADGLILSRSTDEPQHALRHFGQVEGSVLAQARLRKSDAALTLRFDSGPSLLVLTEPARRPKSDLDLWELATPTGVFVVAHGDGALTIEDGADSAPSGPTMGRGDVHTVPHGAGWANKREGSTRVSNVAPTKAEAEAKGREMAKGAKVEHHVHKKDGTIGHSNRYDKESRRSKA